MIARKWRAPVIQDPDKFAARNSLRDQIFRHIGKAQAALGRVDAHGDIVEYKLAIDPNPQLMAVLLELPRKNIAMGWHADLDAIVPGEVIRNGRRWTVAKV